MKDIVYFLSHIGRQLRKKQIDFNIVNKSLQVFRISSSTFYNIINFCCYVEYLFIQCRSLLRTGFSPVIFLFNRRKILVFCILFSYTRFKFKVKFVLLSTEFIIFLGFLFRFISAAFSGKPALRTVSLSIAIVMNY